MREITKQARYLLGRNADAGIGDPEFQPIHAVRATAHDGERDLSVDSELAGVVKKAEKDLPNAGLICVHAADFFGAGNRESVAVPIGERTCGDRNITNQRRYVEVLQKERQAAIRKTGSAMSC